MRKPSPAKLNTAPRTVIGYHGCSISAARQILEAGEFLPSTKAYDWLGEGIYSWEYAPYRALDWARRKCERTGGEPAVIRASIRLGKCLNLLDIEHIPKLRATYEAYVRDTSPPLPMNTKQGAHFLDRAVIDIYCHAAKTETDQPFQTIRGSFAEGKPIYPDSKILEKAHTQIAVRDRSCILQISLVEFPHSIGFFEYSE